LESEKGRRRAMDFRSETLDPWTSDPGLEQLEVLAEA